MLYILVTFLVLFGIQLIYINLTDIPFYYKEIIYDWNYNTIKSVRFNYEIEWLSLKQKKGFCLQLIEQKEMPTLIQTDLFSFQQKTNIHEYVNYGLIIIALVLMIYLAYTSSNSILYEHEKKNITKLISILLLFLLLTIYIYNSELITSILYKTHLSYTDNIYTTSEKQTDSKLVIILLAASIIYYTYCLKSKIKRSFSKYSAYTYLILLNILNENTIIGAEYIYLFIYCEIIILLIIIYNTLSDAKRRTNG